ncbi:hypothetical protein TBLA_0D03350 [Henningerozyma blattae CBS 6284]|uniref:NADH:flavin oxidoreductase/NADH oxidase N-terminal domain-containing protein n=1 Tax=Henningerozyma blattae (strain ATCC 34711 / CBS 6284 / DSM 70876 / NBRC 10599 / NRRL Y-10934 / UCD 77-7) TaxID=1071380 RepID=I2H383_HENB6|nr:hypothetical protein TBLA_0D03350 [Tetrapisispora blattae CBS 6284]CCH60835.1 hypothetical protein TBLA_0D03350 [Tetrapisispora blattae CBS 6284]
MPFNTEFKPVSLKHTTLFKPMKVGKTMVLHRAIIPPLNKMRADPETHILNEELSIEYHGQRSQSPGTMIITEPGNISPEAGGYAGSPVIYSKVQMEVWQKFFSKIHENKSFAWVQLYALGSQASPKFLKANGYKYVSASAGAYIDEIFEKKLRKQIIPKLV